MKIKTKITKGSKFYSVLLMSILLAILLLLTIEALNLGKYPISPKEIFGILFKDVLSLLGIEPFWEKQKETIFFNIRLPRIILSILVGCCLSSAGAVYQGVFRNPMAAPDVLGSSAGAALGAGIAILSKASGQVIMLSAFLFSLLSVALVYLASLRNKGSKVTGLLLSGIMVSSLFQAMNSYIKLVADPNDQLPQITMWLMGSFANANKSDVMFVLFPMAIGLIPLMLIRWRINLLTMNDEEARSMGLNTKKMRLFVILCASLITAASVSVSGIIGYVGMIIPNLVRRFAGNDYTILLPASMISGSIFLLLVDTFARNLNTAEIPIGVLTAFVGCPFFIYLFTREEVS